MSKARNACPICARAAVAEHTPFCSPRCRDRDLLRWLGDGYAIPGPPAQEDDVRVLDSDDDRSL